MEQKQMNIDVSNTLDAPDIKLLKTSLREYADIITGSPLFNRNNNADDINDLLYTFLEDLYIKEPEEVINFINQKPSKKLIENLFKQFGISDKLSRNFPDLLKTKTAYMLSRLFEAKGSNLVFEMFNDVVSEFYHHLNFYNVRIQQRKFISKYESPTLEKIYHLKSDKSIHDKYNMVEQNATTLIDPDIGVKVFTTIHERYHNVEYTIKLFKVAEFDVKLKLDHSSEITILKGQDTKSVMFKKYDIYDKGVRNKNQLRYELEPVLINDPLSIIDEIFETDLRTSKYLMQQMDYFNINYRNTAPMNVFPIITNVLYIQFGTSETMDTMEFLPDLVRMFSMTSTQNDMFSFAIDGTIIKLPMSEYTSLLSYIKLREIQFHNPGWEWGKDSTLPSLDFANMVYPLSKLKEIYELILYYKDMRHEHDTFLEFKRRYFLLIQEFLQRKNTKIFNMVQFNEYLAGNIPNTFEIFWEKLEEFYPNRTNIIGGKDQNLLLKQHVHFIHENYNPETPRDLFNLVAIQDDKYVGLNNSLYDMLKLQFIDKYPRVIQKIDAIQNSVEFLELYLHNYKRVLTEVIKMDNLITYFVNDTFKRFLLSSTFKDEFFDPVVDLFQQYFFKAELSYQNSDTIIHVVRDKMQQVTCGTKEVYKLKIDNHFSALNVNDLIKNEQVRQIKENINENLNDTWNAVITNEDTGEHTFTENDDSGYENGHKT